MARGRAGAARGPTLLGIAAIAAGALVAASPAPARAGSERWRPAARNCFAVDGYRVARLPLEPALALDGTGGGILAWRTLDGAVHAALGLGDGQFSPARTVSAAGRPEDEIPVAAANARGDALLAWDEGQRVNAALRPAGADLEQGRLLGGDLHIWERPAVALDQAGGAAVAWEGPANVLNVRRRAPAAGWARAFRAGHPLRAGFGRVVVAFDPAGGMVLGWVGIVTEGGRVVAGARSLRRTRPLARPIGEPGSTIGPPRLAVDAAGRTLAVWLRNDRLEAAVLAPGRLTYSPGRAITPVGRPVGAWDLAMNSAGQAVVVWVALPPARPRRDREGGIEPPSSPAFSPRRVYAARGTIDAGFGAPTVLSGRQRVVANPRVAIAADGSALAVWADRTNGVSGVGSSVQSASLGADGRWSAPTRISERGLGPLSPQVAVGPDGAFVTAWMRCAPAPGVLRTATRPAGLARFGAPSVLPAP